MGKISSFFLGLVAGLLTGVVIAVVVFLLLTGVTVSHSAVYHGASTSPRHA